jgi:hypothetical protein
MFSTFISTILVVLLVWQRLGDSLSKKLEYVHKEFLSKLYSELHNHQLFSTTLFSSQDKIRDLNSDLKNHAKFLGIGLYPHNFPKEIYEFLHFHQEFFTRYTKIEGIAKQTKEQLRPKDQNLFVSDMFQDFLGFKPQYREHGNVGMDVFYRELAQTIKKENPSQSLRL